VTSARLSALFALVLNYPRLADRLYNRLILNAVSERVPDFIVGADNPDGPYLCRWFLSPWRRLQTRLRAKADAAPTRTNRTIARIAGWLPNLYLHHFLRDDDDRALHDHPSWAVSFMLRGSYVEHTIAAGGIHRREVISAGRVRFLPTRHTHRIELADRRAGDGSTWTLFLFGPTVRDWGFHCPQRGWVPWKEFTAAGKPGEVGPGCDA
jgi:hypothetical protein